MARSLPGSPASDSSCSLPSTPVASLQDYKKSRSTKKASNNELRTPPRHSLLAHSPSPLKMQSTPRLNFGPARQALTPRRALTAIKPVSKATRSGRKSFWVNTGACFSDEELEKDLPDEASPSGRSNLTAVTGVEIIEDSQQLLGDVVTCKQLGADRDGASSDSDEEIVGRSRYIPRSRIIGSESEAEEDADGTGDGDERQLEAEDSAHSNLAAMPAISGFEDDSEDEVIVNRRSRGRRPIIVETDDEDEDVSSPVKISTESNKPDGGSRRPASTSQAHDEDLLAIIDRLYIHDVSSDGGDRQIQAPTVPSKQIIPQDVITISDDESGVEVDGLDDYLLQYSPSPERPPIELPLSPPPVKKSTKTAAKVKGVRANKKAWSVERVRIAQELFDELDADVFKGRLKGAGARVDWNTRLLTTAGTATDKTKRLPNGEVQHEFTIKLSTKVLDEEERILSTVAHEMCHLASWIVNNEYSNPHGRVFQSWGRRVMRARPDIEVTTKHDYEIAYKYSWKCVDEECGKIYKRQSKSIDVNRHACGRCKSRLEPMFATKATSAFQEYLKVNMKNAKLALPGASFGDVMRELSARWKAGGVDHDAYWAGRAAK